MASVALSDLVSVSKMSSTWRRKVFDDLALLWAHKDQQALARKWPELRAHVATAVEHEVKARRLEQSWKVAQSQDDAGNPKAGELDRQLDRVVNALPTKFASLKADLDANDPLLVELEDFQLELLPQGAGAITQLDYQKQLDAFQNVLEALERKDRAALVKRLGVGVQVKKLKQLLPKFEAELNRPGRATVSFGVVKEARQVGNEHVAGYLVLVAARTLSRAATTVALRASLLKPVLAADDAIREEVARSRGRPESVEEPIDPAPAPR
jgi:hypothetical protein